VLLEAALDYAKLGWHILPIVAGQKIPASSHGVKDATTDPVQIRAWWSRWPDANVAVACGKASGIYVIDVDISDSVNGYESLKELPPLPETIRQDTPRGGFHAFYCVRESDPPCNKNDFRTGVDIRGDGYYVLLPPSKSRSHGSYTWAKGQSPWERGLNEYPQSFRPVTKTPWAAAGTIAGGLSGRAAVNPAAQGDSTLRRASFYLAECDPAIQGMGGHDSLLWAAVAMVHGFLLSDADATKLLVDEYNPRCTPEWDMSIPSEQRDFTRKVQEARKLKPQKAPGWLLEDAAYSFIIPEVSIDSAAMIRRFQDEQETQRKKALIGPVSHSVPMEGNSELEYLQKPPGLIGDICNWINRTALKRQPFLALACTLTFCGTLFGRKVTDYLDNRTNLYCMGIALSSAGKAHAPNQIRKLCEHAGCLDLLGGDEAASDAAIECRLERNPATLFLWDEIGLLLSYIQSGSNPHVARIVSLLMKLYSSAGTIYKGREYADMEKQRTIVQPCCSVYGTSTPSRFCEGITLDELQDGWLSRCLVFEALENPIKTRSNQREPIPADISDLVNLWSTREVGEQAGDIESFSAFQSRMGSTLAPAPEQMMVPTTPEAERIFVEFDNSSVGIGIQNPDLLCLWAKAEENARKIALILAAGCDFEKPTVTMEVAKYACVLIKYLLIHFVNSTVPNIVSSKVDLNKHKILGIIKKAGVGGCSTRVITIKARWSNLKQRRDLLADLLEGEEIVGRQTDDGRGILYWTADNYIKYLKKEDK